MGMTGTLLGNAKHMVHDGTAEARGTTIKRGFACATNPVALPKHAETQLSSFPSLPNISE
jgi:hypothetical protein